MAIVTTPPSLIPYVWCRGGRRVEGEIVDSLGRGFPIENPEFDSGSVGLAKIDIPIPNRLEESVTCDALIAKVHQAFAFFTTEDVEKIDKINSA